MVRGAFVNRAPAERPTFAAALKRYLADRDRRLAGEDRKKDGVAQPLAANTVRLGLALLGHLFTGAIKERRVGLPQKPVLNIRRPAAPRCA